MEEAARYGLGGGRIDWPALIDIPDVYISPVMMTLDLFILRPH